MHAIVIEIEIEIQVMYLSDIIKIYIYAGYAK